MSLPNPAKPIFGIANFTQENRDGESCASSKKGPYKRDPRWDDPWRVPKYPFKNRGQALQVHVRNGQDVDPRPSYILSPSDVTSLQSVLPTRQLGKDWIPQLECVLLTEYRLPPDHVEKLSMQQVLSILKQKPMNQRPKGMGLPDADGTTLDTDLMVDPPIDDIELEVIPKLPQSTDATG